MFPVSCLFEFVPLSREFKKDSWRDIKNRKSQKAPFFSLVIWWFLKSWQEDGCAAKVCVWKMKGIFVFCHSSRAPDYDLKRKPWETRMNADKLNISDAVCISPSIIHLSMDLWAYKSLPHIFSCINQQAIYPTQSCKCMPNTSVHP